MNRLLISVLVVMIGVNASIAKELPQTELAALEESYRQMRTALQLKEPYMKTLRDVVATLAAEVEQKRLRHTTAQAELQAVDQSVNTLLELLLRQVVGAEATATEAERYGWIRELQQEFVVNGTPLPEKISRTIEAYRAVADSARFAEIEEGSVLIDGERYRGSILRVGGLASFFMTPDGSLVARAIAEQGSYTRIDGSYSAAIRDAGDHLQRRKLPALTALPIGRITPP